MSAQRLAVLALASSLCLASCGKKHPTAVVVAVSSEGGVPDDIDFLELVVSRDGGTRFDEVYDLPRGAALPGTITLSADGSGSPTTVLVRAKRQPAADWLVIRKATLAFSPEHTKLLRMPLRYSCYDLPCEGDLTCIGGLCRSPTVDVETLPDFVSNDQVIVAGPHGALPSDACFVPPACLAHVAPVGVDASCSFDVPAPGPFNVAMTWIDADEPVVLDVDAQEGFTFSGTRATLSEGLCKALSSQNGKPPRATGVLVSTDCPTKRPDQPVCVLDSGQTALGGAGGSAGTSGGGGSGGTAGIGTAGGGAGGQAGAGGAAGSGGGGTAGEGGTAGASGTSGAAGSGGCGIPQKPGFLEVCNGLDDDANGCADDGDPCASQFETAANVASWTCDGAKGQCSIAACASGFTDANGFAFDGCESGKPAYQSGADAVAIFAGSDAGNQRLVTLQNGAPVAIVRPAFEVSSAALARFEPTYPSEGSTLVFAATRAGVSGILAAPAFDVLHGSTLESLAVATDAQGPLVPVSSSDPLASAPTLCGGPRSMLGFLGAGAKGGQAEVRSLLAPAEPWNVESTDLDPMSHPNSGRVSVAYAPDPFMPSNGTYVAAFGDANGNLELFTRDPAMGLWAQATSVSMMGLPVAAGTSPIAVADGSSSTPGVVWVDGSTSKLCVLSSQDQAGTIWGSAPYCFPGKVIGQPSADVNGIQLANVVAWVSDDGSGKLSVVVWVGVLESAAMSPAPLVVDSGAGPWVSPAVVATTGSSSSLGMVVYGSTTLKAREITQGGTIALGAPIDLGGPAPSFVAAALYSPAP